MLVVISPAKKLDMDPVAGLDHSDPIYSTDARDLAQIARDLDASQLKKLMGISDKLASLNADRFARFGTMESKQAALAFAGDTYQGLEAATLESDEMAWAQDHLRILSGLYGLLRPLDRIEPYRLEMGSRLKTPRGNSLYDYWGDRLATGLNEQAAALGTDTLVNCASQEYFGAVPLGALDLRVITPVFMEERDGTEKVISFHAKRARGAMARFIVQNRLQDASSLCDFDTGGYAYRPELGEDDKMVFVRPS